MDTFEMTRYKALSRLKLSAGLVFLLILFFLGVDYERRTAPCFQMTILTPKVAAVDKAEVVVENKHDETARAEVKSDVRTEAAVDVKPEVKVDAVSAFLSYLQEIEGKAREVSRPQSALLQVKLPQTEAKKAADADVLVIDGAIEVFEPEGSAREVSNEKEVMEVNLDDDVLTESEAEERLDVLDDGARGGYDTVVGTAALKQAETVEREEAVISKSIGAVAYDEDDLKPTDDGVQGEDVLKPVGVSMRGGVRDNVSAVRGGETDERGEILEESQNLTKDLTQDVVNNEEKSSEMQEESADDEAIDMMKDIIAREKGESGQK